MITLEGNQLVFRFPEVHEDAICSINFQRTLRISAMRALRLGDRGSPRGTSLSIRTGRT